MAGGESEYAYIYSGGKLNDKALAYESYIYSGGTQTVLNGGVDDYAQFSGGRPSSSVSGQRSAKPNKRQHNFGQRSRKDVG